jgi:hypothetical protein
MAAELKLELFVAGQATQLQVMTARVTELLDQVLQVPYEFKAIDVLEQPELADVAHILVTPTLVVRYKSKERRLVGDLSDLTKLQLVIADSQKQ